MNNNLIEQAPPLLRINTEQARKLEEGGLLIDQWVLDFDRKQQARWEAWRTSPFYANFCRMIPCPST